MFMNGQVYKLRRNSVADYCFPDEVLQQYTGGEQKPFTFIASSVDASGNAYDAQGNMIAIADEFELFSSK